MREADRIYTVAFTGRSGSGKSFAAGYFRKKGIPSIDCDLLAARVLKAGSGCLDELATAFGTDIINPDGKLNRRLLASRAFGSRESKHILDGITHPYILVELKKEIDILQKAGERLCIIEAPALLESGLQESVDSVVLFISPESDLIARIVQRDAIDREDAGQRIKMQIEESLLKEIADYIVYNNGTIPEFTGELDKLYGKLVEWSSI